MSDPRDEFAALSAGLRGHLARERERGRTHLVSASLKRVLVEGAPPRPRRAAPAPPADRAIPASPASLRSSASPASPTSPAPPASSAPAGGGRGKKLPLIDPEPETADYRERMERLAGLDRKASTCTDCGLCRSRTHVVFSRGRARTPVMFVGEAPGANEDRQGKPFVGKAGQLLDQILDAAGFRRDEVYVANILKCRPPDNRDPRPEEISACTKYLTEQIELVQPRIICALGKFAAQFLTGNPDAPMGRLRGRIHYYRDRIMVVPTYHPAALLRNPGWKRMVWEDVQLLRKEYLR